jgi:hypothetical protein
MSRATYRAAQLDCLGFELTDEAAALLRQQEAALKQCADSLERVLTYCEVHEVRAIPQSIGAMKSAVFAINAAKECLK